MSLILVYFLITLLVQICTFVLLSIHRKNTGFFNFSFFWFNMLFLLIPFYVQYSNNTLPWGGIYNEDIILISFTLLSIFTISYSIGYMLKFKKNNMIMVTVKKNRKNKLFFLLLFVVNSLFSLVLISNTTSLIYILPRGAIYIYGSISVMLYLITKITWFFLLVLSYYVFEKKSFIPNLFFILLVVFCIILFNPISNPRFIFFGFIIAFLFLFFKIKIFNSLRNNFILFIGLLYLQLTILPIVKHLITFLESENKLEQLFTVNFSYFYSINFDAYQQFLNTVEYIQGTKNYDFFYSIISGILFFIPRAVWPDKAINTGEIIAEYKGYHYTNLSEPFVSNLYLSGGIIGIIIGGLLLGFLFRRLDYGLYTYLYFNNKTFLSFISISLAGFTIIFFRGAFNATFPMYGALIYLFFLFYVINKIAIKEENF